MRSKFRQKSNEPQFFGISKVQAVFSDELSTSFFSAGIAQVIGKGL